MEHLFTGRISEIKEVRSGEGAKGEWANASFEVTESNPQNENYPEIALFDFFKNGEYLDQAKKFDQNFKVGDEVSVHYNHKKNTYKKQDGSEGVFYKTSAWKIDKLGASSGTPPAQQFEPAEDMNEEDFDDLPF